MLVNGHYILSEEVVAFERAFGAYLEVAHVRGVNSGTDALMLALLALGVGPGDEVVTQANTFHATVAAIRLVGATPVLVDVDETTFLIDDAWLGAAMTTRTRVLMPVHLFGQPTPMTPILALADTHQLAVVEDAAQAHGAKLNGRRVGSFGTAACFSFHPSKNLAGAGDGGAVVTNRAELAVALEHRRALGQAAQNHHVTIGLNSKLDAIQAKILHYKLAFLDAWNASRRLIAARYRDQLSHLPLQFQGEVPGSEPVFHLFQIRTDRRDALLEHLRASGVDAIVRYPTPIHLQPAFADCGWRKGQFPIAERLAGELLCLPLRPDMSMGEVDYVTEVVDAFFRGERRRRH